ncbi:hypothetical protein B0A48_11092 [Cryoendolithus antarcticus]|uniref:Ecp2 effector protein domain-containing protein n=1 Tax=Cryoendolithus antarcticus TaxID=1507870 RepID=A0A1V8SUQ9_9PEZI|nr:hypothetical protein B0A48_11092 [Cryoendolithus antarcticus]
MPQSQQSRLSKTQLLTCVLCWHVAEAQVSTAGGNVTEVTSITTVGSSTITGTPLSISHTNAKNTEESTEIFTPTSIQLSGITPPITAGTTVTTTNSAGETVAVAVAVGAGVVAGGALAGWLYKPVPGGLPAPTEPPTLSTESQPDDSKTTTTSEIASSTTTSTTEEAPACPFTSKGSSVTFAKVDAQPQWTVALPTASTASAHSPECTPHGGNSQLFRGTDPGYINALAEIFCKGDLTKDQAKTLGQGDLPSDSTWKNANLQGIRVNFGFEYGLSDPGCARNCVDAYKFASTRCQYDSHTLFGSASLEQGCGKYDLTVDADVVTKLTCSGAPDPISQKYDYRDAALDAVNNFCTAHDGAELKQNDPSTDIKESAFSATYLSGCTGSGTYKIFKDTCVKYLTQTIDGCDVDTTMYKHGGSLTELDNCGSFEFHPVSNDEFFCYPKNKDGGLITGGKGVAISPEIAKDAIAQFCDRDSKDQTYTLDPKNIPDPNDFSGDSCTKKGAASCGYYYSNDGKRAEGNNVENLFIRIEAKYDNLGRNCAPNAEYAIHGERCHQELSKLIGIEPKGQCVSSDPSKLELGSFLENGDKGCVLWNMWAVQTAPSRSMRIKRAPEMITA